MKNPIYFQNISKYESKLLLKKLGDIIKVVGSNLDFSIEMVQWDGPKKRKRNNWSLVYRWLHCALHNKLGNHEKQKERITASYRALSRIGLLFIKPQSDKIFVVAEKYFICKTDISYLWQTDTRKISYELFNFKIFKNYFVEIVRESTIEPNASVGTGRREKGGWHDKLGCFSTVKNYLQT